MGEPGAAGCWCAAGAACGGAWVAVAAACLGAALAEGAPQEGQKRAPSSNFVPHFPQNAIRIPPLKLKPGTVPSAELVSRFSLAPQFVQIQKLLSDDSFSARLVLSSPLPTF